MADISSYLEEAILNHVFRNSTGGNNYTSTKIFAGLVTSSASSEDLEDGTLTNEVSAYTGNRPEITFTVPTQSSGGKAIIKNVAQIDYEDMPSATVRFAVLCDSSTIGAGNILWHLKLSSDKVMNSGDICRIREEELQIDLD